MSLLVGIGSAFVGGTLGTIDGKLILRSALVSVVCYGSIFVARALWGMIVAPVKLDQQIQVEFDNLDRQRKAELQAKENDLAKTRTREIELKELLSAKHPHDEYLQSAVSDALGRLSDRERDFVRWLLDATRAGQGQIHEAGFTSHVEALGVLRKTANIQLLTYDSFRPGNGQVEMDRFYQINPGLVNALRNVLHSPLRPVTPPPE